MITSLIATHRLARGAAAAALRGAARALDGADPPPSRAHIVERLTDVLGLASRCVLPAEHRLSEASCRRLAWVVAPLVATWIDEARSIDLEESRP